MPRARSVPRADLVSRAMSQFWTTGYEATSIDDLVAATGANRQALYSDFGGKAALFSAALEIYSEEVVTPAFAPVEAPGAGLEEIAAYFESQIARAESMGLPGPGCLMANTMTERAPHAPEVANTVARHTARLEAGFQNALQSVATAPRASDLAAILVVFTNGLWSMSRIVSDAAALRRAVSVMLSVLEQETRQ